MKSDLIESESRLHQDLYKINKTNIFKIIICPDTVQIRYKNNVHLSLLML
jgi:hypothetical protein